MEHLFRTQLEMTSSSLWLMSGILAMLKRDGFQPSDPTLFNAALSSVSTSLSQQARTALAGSSFVRAKRRESLLTHKIDLFATSANHRCSTYFSPYRDPQSAGTDAFFQSWDGLQVYAFPPFAIIPRVLVKLRESRGTKLTLVAQRPWFPDLLQLSLAPPVVLPDLLLLPRSRLRYPGLHRLRLHAWRLSSDSPEQLVSRLE